MGQRFSLDSLLRVLRLGRKQKEDPLRGFLQNPVGSIGSQIRGSAFKIFPGVRVNKSSGVGIFRTVGTRA